MPTTFWIFSFLNDNKWYFINFLINCTQFRNTCHAHHSFFVCLFNWKLITLQYCGDFCHTFTWISHGCTCVPYPEPPSNLPSPPSGSSQCTSPKHPVSCIKPGLAIYFTYSNIHVSMLSLKSCYPCLLSQSPKVSSLHLCLFCCLTYRVIITIFLNSIYMP